jgi:hypothetical protein
VKAGSNTAVPITVAVDSCVASFIQANRDYCTHDTTMPSTCNSVTTSYTALAYPHPLVDDTPAPQGGSIVYAPFIH